MRKLSRRGFLSGAAVTAGSSALVACSNAQEGGENGLSPEEIEVRLKSQTVAFDGVHQAGIDTPGQAHVNLVGFNLVDDMDKTKLVNLMRTWTEDARALCAGQSPVGSLEPEMAVTPANLTITCGFGPKVFEVAGKESVKPDWLRPIPEFEHDDLDPAWGQTDIVLQVCCDDPLTLAHAVRHMIRSSSWYVETAWMQQGFANADGAKASNQTARNLFGQVDGTVNPQTPEDFDYQVWIDEGEAWAMGGSAMVIRRIRMNLDTWEMLDRGSREQVIGRDLEKGAPLSGGDEHTPADFEATDNYGLPWIDPASHMARARPTIDNPEQVLLRRPFSYDLPPEPGSDQLSNSGLLFICFQKNPDKQFTPIQQRLDEQDRLNEWITHIGSSVYFIPPGVSTDGSSPDSFWAERLLT